MKKRGPLVRPVNLAAKSLKEGQFRQRVVRDRTKYTRKGRTASKRNVEAFIHGMKLFVS